MGGGRSPLGVAYDLPVRAVPAAARCRFPWVALLVVAGLALQHEIVRVQCDLRVVAVYVVQPCPPVVHYLAGLYAAGLAQPSVNGQPFIYIRIARSAPRLGSVKLLLVDMSRPPSAPASAMPVIMLKQKDRPSGSPSRYYFTTNYTDMRCQVLFFRLTCW